MAALSAEGIILRKYLLRETSYILVVYTKEFGKIKGVLKGARNPYPQFAGNFEIFTKVDLFFYRKKRQKMELVTGCEAIEPYTRARKDIERLTYANYFIELIDTVTQEHDPDRALYDVLEEGLRMLASDSSPRRAARVFEVKLLDAAGLGLTLDRCVRCGSANSEKYFFNVKEGGIICAGCSKNTAGCFAVSPGTLNFIEKVRSAPFDRMQNIKVAREVGGELETVLKKAVQYHTGRKARSMDFLERIEKDGILQAEGERVKG